MRTGNSGNLPATGFVKDLRTVADVATVAIDRANREEVERTHLHCVHSRGSHHAYQCSLKGAATTGNGGNTVVFAEVSALLSGNGSAMRARLLRQRRAEYRSRRQRRRSQAYYGAHTPGLTVLGANKSGGTGESAPHDLAKSWRLPEFPRRRHCVPVGRVARGTMVDATAGCTTLLRRASPTNCAAANGCTRQRCPVQGRALCDACRRCALAWDSKFRVALSGAKWETETRMSTLDHDLKQLRAIEKRLIKRLKAEGMHDPAAEVRRRIANDALQSRGATARGLARRAERDEMDRRMGLVSTRPTCTRTATQLICDAAGRVRTDD